MDHRKFKNQKSVTPSSKEKTVTKSSEAPTRYFGHNITDLRGCLRSGSLSSVKECAWLDDDEHDGTINLVVSPVLSQMSSVVVGLNQQ